MTNKGYEIVGWLGFVLIVSAYLLLTIKIMSNNSWSYHAMNLSGALCMVANAKYKDSRPLFWLNLVWALIALVGVYQEF